ncbi:MAG: hypothetical protein LRY66_09625 [Saccharospirillaceae bacterium]|nr:hypothetical protein [Saccharospirillaceae bacterium]MCD8531602.1 hypothetical protein [Saccharospirillaceae bacterium]
MNLQPTLWPESLSSDPQRLAQLRRAGETALQDFPPAWLSQWPDVWAPLAAWLAAEKATITASVPLIGIHGGQGSGKSTLCRALAQVYRQVLGWNTVVLSIDDLYLTHSERSQLALNIHPLLSTRGVPGTHDVNLGLLLTRQLRQLNEGQRLMIPAFDKIQDDRLPENYWHTVTGPVDLILFEGWCVGCLPVAEEDLQEPVNSLEASDDSNGQWRRWVNQQLAGRYADWFAQIDRLLMLKVPGMNAVQQWRREQEDSNRKQSEALSQNKIRLSKTTDRSLSETGLIRFIQHYQRLTEQALHALPARADLVLELDARHQVAAIHGKAQEVNKP